MEQYIMQDDVKVFYVTAASFPLGVGGAFTTLQSKLPAGDGRMLYGISFPDHGTIVYKAAAEEVFDGEAAQYGLETFIIKKGTYITETLINWKKDESSIGKAFGALLKDPRIDKKGACVERYINADDVVCMVRLDV